MSDQNKPATVTSLPQKQAAAPAAAGVKPPQPKPVPKTAAQRLDDLERAVMGLFQRHDALGKDHMTVKEALKLLGGKVDALAKANVDGKPPTDETLSQIMIDTNVKELEGKVSGLVKAKVLVATDIVGDETFIVGRELAFDSDKVTNPRLQFTLKALNKEIAEKLNGHLVGDIIAIAEGQARFEILEVYNIQEPPAVAPAAPAADAPASGTDASPAAPAQAAPVAQAPAAPAPVAAAPAAAPTPAPTAAAPTAPTAAATPTPVPATSN